MEGGDIAMLPETTQDNLFKHFIDVYADDFILMAIAASQQQQLA
jgi:hypothetical protein